MVDRLDEGAIAAELGPLDYKGLYKACSADYFIKRTILSLIIFVIFWLLIWFSGCWEGSISGTRRRSA